MNIYTVRDNLKNTIKGKRVLLDSLKPSPEAGYEILHHMVSMNIEELERILADVEVCCKKESDDSWITNPDRMGGGGWTAEELDPNRGWK